MTLHKNAQGRLRRRIGVAIVAVAAGATGLLSAEPLSAELVLSYDMNEGTGTAVGDSSGNSRHAMMNASLAAQPGNWTTGRSGLAGDNAIHFTQSVGPTGYIVWDDASDPLPLTDGGSFTVEAWIKPDGFAADEYLFAIGETIGTTIALRWDPSLTANATTLNKVAVTTVDGSFQDNVLALSSGNELTAGEWQHVALTYTETDATNSTLEFFTDGILAGSTNLGYHIEDVTTKVHIGLTPGNVWYRQYRGDVDDFRITAAAVPEASSGLLVLCGALGALAVRAIRR